jgi:hypothetical protein
MQADPFEGLTRFFERQIRFTEVEDCVEMIDWIEQDEGGQAVGLTQEHRFWVVEFTKPGSNLAVGTLQPFLESTLRGGGASNIDYVHGECVICKLTSIPGNVGFFMPQMKKSDLFKTVILDGALPKKTFSMGEAHEKRFYMECRKIER